MWFFRLLGHLFNLLMALVVFALGGGMAFIGLLAGVSVYTNTEALGAIQNAFTALWLTPIGVAVGATGIAMFVDYADDAWGALKRAF